ncbi:hypothetical protein [Oligoflexus tunisiensis]|uniref:hypothetical protein n=1 Tax=Oligoflexus tunisiensis TaxID=708132 RepID=UPI001C407EFA|nr:hypothetical protein [Oligoflexus tunisiensis]
MLIQEKAQGLYTKFEELDFVGVLPSLASLLEKVQHDQRPGVVSQYKVPLLIPFGHASFDPGDGTTTRPLK